MNQKQDLSSPKTSWLQLVWSVICAAFGVQNNKNRERDFADKNNLKWFIVAGILFTITFIFTIYALVVLALKLAT